MPTVQKQCNPSHSDVRRQQGKNDNHTVKINCCGSSGSSGAEGMSDRDANSSLQTWCGYIVCAGLLASVGAGIYFTYTGATCLQGQGMNAHSTVTNITTAHPESSDEIAKCVGNLVGGVAAIIAPIALYCLSVCGVLIAKQSHPLERRAQKLTA